MALFLLEEGESLSIFVEASFDAASLFGGKRRSILEVDTKVCAEFVLACNRCVSCPVLVVLQEGTLKNGGGHLSGADCLEGINVEFTARLSHLFLLI